MSNEAKPEGAIKKRPHAATTYKRIPWAVCRYCGLVYLKNKRTEKAIKDGCWIFRDE